jgi:hypothetical protein
MNDFTTVCANLSNLDPYKRVNYVNGLVLGADDLVQEQLYHLEKNRLHNRLLHGYGTLCGLSVDLSDPGDGPRLTVAPGVAVDPRGRAIRVPEAYCANLTAWLQSHAAEVQDRLAASPPLSPPEPLSLYLVLCHRECETDEVPIPGGPCKTLEASSVASRIQDAFELALRFEPPDQIEQEAVRDLVALIRAIEISEDPGGLTEGGIADLVRALTGSGSPPLSSPPLGSPPGSPPTGMQHMHPDDVDALLRVAMRVWVTEVRPALLPSGANCAAGPPEEGCVLLAEVILNLDGGPSLVGDPLLDESQRPYLLHTRLLQECLACHRGDASANLESLSHADLHDLLADDHPQYLLVDGSRPLTGDLGAGGNRITGLGEGSVDGDAVRFEQAVKIDDIAGGDLVDNYPNPTVAGLRGRPLSDVDPAAGQVLTWSGNRWQPSTPAVIGGFVEAPGQNARYAIVAAGLFDAAGQPLGSVYNALSATLLGALEYRLAWPRYQPPPNDGIVPPPDLVYIVKGTIVDPERPGFLRVLRFEQEGIRIRVSDIQDANRVQAFMVEISAYGRADLG